MTPRVCYLALAATGLLSGCVGGPWKVDPGDCRTSDDCEPGEICVGRFCSTLCTRTADCPNPTEICTEGFCSVADELTCESDDDCAELMPCPGLFICAGGECVTANAGFDWCTPDEQRSCGYCGTQTCTGVCDWGDCQGEGVCADGETQGCGSCQSQTCDANCAWGPCSGDSICDPETTEPCGLCGTRTCTASCEWGACQGQGVCTPEFTQSCGACESQVCDSNCKWGTCEGVTICPPGTEQGCGNCGIQTCDASCDWEDCRDEGVCSADATRPCGDCGVQTCTGSCTWGPCEDEGCEPGTTRACGANGIQTCSSACTWCNCLRNSAVCSGTAGQWEGCRGNGCAVCVELVESYPCYFDNHPDCLPNTGCGGQHYRCNTKCPEPNTEDTCACGAGAEWSGCGGDPCSVCSERVEDFACYFINRPSCNADSTCDAAYAPCSDLCPTPIAADEGTKP